MFFKMVQHTLLLWKHFPIIATHVAIMDIEPLHWFRWFLFLCCVANWIANNGIGDLDVVCNQRVEEYVLVEWLLVGIAEVRSNLA